MHRLARSGISMQRAGMSEYVPLASAQVACSSDPLAQSVGSCAHCLARRAVGTGLPFLGHHEQLYGTIIRTSLRKPHEPARAPGAARRWALASFALLLSARCVLR